MSTTEQQIEKAIEQITDAPAHVIENIKRADLSDGAKLGLLYFADPEFRHALQERMVSLAAEALVARAAR